MCGQHFRAGNSRPWSSALSAGPAGTVLRALRRADPPTTDASSSFYCPEDRRPTGRRAPGCDLMGSHRSSPHSPSSAGSPRGGPLRRRAERPLMHAPLASPGDPSFNSPLGMDARPHLPCFCEPEAPNLTKCKTVKL